MALNFIQAGENVELPVTSGAKSGDPDLVNQLAAVLLWDANDQNRAVCAVTGVFKLTVYGRSDGANKKVYVGDSLYWDAGDGQINKDSTNGVFFGYALDTVTAGSSAAIPVRLKQ
jgi:predicted RecA/RadA family phage recombinase